MNKIRWGILGCGDVTEVKSGPAFQKAPNSELVAVMRRDAAKAADYARRHNVPRWYADADQLIHDKDVDAVYIATPPGSHEFYAHKVATAGKPCYVEKPMTRNAAEAQRVTDAFRTRNIPLFIAYYRRAMPRFRQVKKLLDQGHIGQPRMLLYFYSDFVARQDPAPWRVIPEHSGGGLFLDLASHALDLIDFFVGPTPPITLKFATAQNTARQYPVEDTVSLVATHPNYPEGIIARWCFAEENKTDLFTILGEHEASLTFSCFGNEPIFLKKPGGGDCQSFDIPKPVHVHQPLVETIVNELLDPNTPSRCPSTPESALRTQILMDQCLHDYYQGREDGFWTRSLESHL
jgi:predicted dehydrogenase